MIRAVAAASAPLAASVTVNPADSSMTRAKARKPSWSSTTRTAGNGAMASVSHRAAALASGLALTVTRAGRPRFVI